MTRKRFSIYPSPSLDRALAERLIDTDAANDERAEPLRGRSATIAAMVERYAEIVRQHTPELTCEEWMLICDSLNGYWTNDAPRLAALGIAHNVSDNDQLNGAGRRFGCDGQALAKRIQSMPFAEQIAIMDVSERFWAGSAREGDTYPELFKRLAGKLAPSDTSAPTQ